MKFLLQNPIPKIVKALSKKERLIFYLASAILAISSLTYGALIVKTEAYVIPTEGGTYREGVVGQPAFINPILPTGASTETDRTLSRLVFSSLAEMAETITHSADGKTWNVRLKEDIFWHDGEKLTADDIVFTVDIIHNPEVRSWLQGSFNGVTVVRVSELELEFTLQNSYAFFAEDHLNSLRPIPKHIFVDIPVINFTRSAFGLAPIGSGPYKAVSHNKDSRGFVESFSLKSNKDYFERSPYIENLIFKFYKKEPELVSNYNLGKIDGFSLSTADSLSERPIIIRHEAHYLGSSRYYAIFINQNLAPDALSEKSVRGALSSAINREDLIESALAGKGVPFFGPTSISSESSANFSNESLNGLNIRIVVPDEPFLVTTAEEVKKDWEILGVQVELIVRSLRDIQEDILRNTDYEMILFGNIVKESNDLFAFWHSSKKFFPDQNLALYDNSHVDSLLETYRKTFDEATRDRILQEISNQITNDIPAIFLYSPDYVYVTTPALGGFNDAKIINTIDDRFSEIANWFIKSKRSFRKPIVAGDESL
ncbi:ABC transporter substrate-binding protein [Patescibacteria group bacterium]|nr:ABC transporter substrate-binding protein [Patescibacteria group bacterium]